VFTKRYDMKLIKIIKSYRDKIWPVICGSKFSKAANEGYYRKLLADNVATETVFTRQIEIDLHRTFPERIEYKYEIKIT